VRGDEALVELRPFLGILYDPDRLDDVFAVLAPPYDVISRQEREVYYERHQHNVVRLIYGRDEPEDSEVENRYTRAAHYLRTWLREGVLQQDAKPAMYLCAEEYVLPDGSRRERQGLIALCRLEPYDRGIVLPHEETSPVPKRMLFDLRSAVKANLSQIFALYVDDTGKLQALLAAQRQKAARLSFRDGDSMLHRVWSMNEPSLLEQIRQVVTDSWALIADGHHRYETCLAYQQMMRQAIPQATGNEWFNFAMMYLTEVHDAGLTILPTHRVLQGLSPAFVKQIPVCLADTCEVEALPFQTPAEREAQRQRLLQEMRRRSANSHVFGLYTGDNVLWLVTYRGSLATPQPVASEPMETGTDLDVSFLHDVLLEKILGIEVREETIAFTQDDVAALDLVACQDYQVVFLLNPTRVEQVVQHAIAGKRMPRKSTYFYPKLLTGIVLHKEVGDEDHFG
jgi:uncharacterized protein (DUF1015 family)